MLALLVLALMPMRTLTPAQACWSRDRWLAGTITVTIIWLATQEPVLAVAALAAVAQWQGPAQVPALIVWAAILGMWFLVAALPTSGAPWLRWGFAAAAVLHAGVCAAQRLWLLTHGRPLGAYHVLGLLGHRTFAAGAMVLTLPFTWPWLTIPVLGGLLITESWLGWVAAAAALSVLAPWTVGVGAILCAVVLWVPWVWHRHSLLDSVRVRLGTYRVLWRALTWRGRGPGSAEWLMNRSNAPHAGLAHCEPLVYAVEYGAVGVLAMALLLVRVVPHLRIGDPWSAAVVGGLILMLGSTPAHVPQLGALWWAQVAWVATR